MRSRRRSGCAIALSLDVLGDPWSLLIVRDIMFHGRRRFDELLAGSAEGIARSVLASRLKRLVALSLLAQLDDPLDDRRYFYRLTERSIQLVPVLAALGGWALRHTAVDETRSAYIKKLEAGGPALWTAFMQELRRTHQLRPRLIGWREYERPRPGPIRSKLR